MSQTLGEHVTEVIGGNPAEVISKILVGAVAALWGWASAIGLILLGYFVLVLVDVIFGVALSQREGRKFEFVRIISGPTKKLGLTAALFIGAAVIASMTSQLWILPGVAGFVCTAQFIDCADKYGKLTGSKVVEWIKEKLGSFVNSKGQNSNAGSNG